MTTFNWKAVMAGAVGGLIAAAHIDYQSFKAWKSFKDAFAYDWGLALWRWFKGAVIGGLVAAGFGA